MWRKFGSSASLALHLHPDPFGVNHAADDRAAGARLERGLDVGFGHDGDPADAHVERVETVLRVDVRQQLVDARQRPLRDFEIGAHAHEQTLEVLRQSTAGDVGHRLRLHAAGFQAVDHVVIQAGRLEPGREFLVRDVRRVILEHAAHQRPAVGVDAV